MTNKEFNETVTEGHELNRLHRKIDEQQCKIARLREAMRNIVANDESDKYSKWLDTQYRMRSIAEAALKETSDDT